MHGGSEGTDTIQKMEDSMARQRKTLVSAYIETMDRTHSFGAALSAAGRAMDNAACTEADILALGRLLLETGDAYEPEFDRARHASAKRAAVVHACMAAVELQTKREAAAFESRLSGEERAQADKVIELIRSQNESGDQTVSFIFETNPPTEEELLLPANAEDAELAGFLDIARAYILKAMRTDGVILLGRHVMDKVQLAGIIVRKKKMRMIGKAGLAELTQHLPEFIMTVPPLFEMEKRS